MDAHTLRTTRLCVGEENNRRLVVATLSAPAAAPSTISESLSDKALEAPLSGASPSAHTRLRRARLVVT